MKKITLALCACAFALTGLLASCSNEAATSVNYTDVGSYTNTYKYAVKGTITTTDVDTIKLDDSHNPSKTGKVDGTTTTTTTVIDNGAATVKWNSNENRESNYTDYSIMGQYSYTATTKIAQKDLGVDVKDNPVVTEAGSDFLIFDIKEVDGEYYLIIDGEAGAKKLDSFAIDEEEGAFDGEFGGEFTLTLKYTEDDSTFEAFAPGDFEFTEDYTKTTSTGYTIYQQWKTKDEAEWTDTKTTEFKLTFYPLQDFDPEAEVEEDEE